MFLVAMWDQKLYHVIDRKQRQVIFTISQDSNFKCWGMCLLPNIPDLIVTRDEWGINFLDTNTRKIQKVKGQTYGISTNLYGHGQIL